MVLLWVGAGVGAAGLQQSPPPWGMPRLASPRLRLSVPLGLFLVFSVFLRRTDLKVWCHGLVRVPEGEEKGSKMCPAATGGDFGDGGTEVTET